MKKYFGTDGIRGTVGMAPMTSDFLIKMGWSIGLALKKHGAKRIFLGKDTRVSGDLLEASLLVGLFSVGIDCYLLGVIATPAVAYLTQASKFDAGIVISASHNKFQDNGVKIFSSQGTKISSDIEQSIEEFLHKTSYSMTAAKELGRSYPAYDYIEKYTDYCIKILNDYSLFAHFKIVIDPANGANYQFSKALFERLGMTITMIHDKPDGVNINNSCGSTDVNSLQKMVLKEKAHLGIAFDGDGDRLIMVDEQGEVVDGDELLFIIAYAGAYCRQLIPGVVGTTMSNLGLEESLKALKIAFERTHVGDRYILEALKRNNWKIGGEASGHIMHLDYATTGDATIAALLILQAMQLTGETLHTLKKKMLKFPQSLVNVPVAIRHNPMEIDEISRFVTYAEQKLHPKGRVLLRASGTEPLIRVMIEGEDGAQVKILAHELAAIVENCYKARHLR